MDPSAIAKAIIDQFVTVWHAPVPFLIALGILGWLIWLAVKREYETRLANAASTIKLLKEQLDFRQATEAISIAASRVAHEVAEERLDTPEQPEATLWSVAGTDVAIPHLKKIVAGKTGAQAQVLLADYLGKRMTVSGQVKDVSPYGAMPGGLIAIRKDGEFIFAYFKSMTDPRFTAMSAGDSVTVRGILDSVSKLSVDLVQCELA